MRSLFLSTLDIDIAVLKRLVPLWHYVLPDSDENLQHRICAVVRPTEEEVVVEVEVNIDGWARSRQENGAYTQIRSRPVSSIMRHAWLACKGPKLQPLCPPHVRRDWSISL